MVELRIKSRYDIKNSYSYPLYHIPSQKLGILVEKKRQSISAFFLYQIPVLRMFMKHFSLIKTKIETEKINPNILNKKGFSALNPTVAEVQFNVTTVRENCEM